MAAFTPAMVTYALLPDDSGCSNPSHWIDNRALAANTAETFSVPTGANRVFITATIDTWIAYTFTGSDDQTAAVPSADTTTGVGVELISAGKEFKGKYLGGISKISLIAGATSLVSLAYFT